MKYKAKKLENGSWAVFMGKKLLKDSETTCGAEAVQLALIESHIFYQMEMNKVWDDLKSFSNIVNSESSTGKRLLGDRALPLGNDKSIEQNDLMIAGYVYFKEAY